MKSEVEFTCEVFRTDPDLPPLTAKEAAVIENALRDAAKKLWPSRRVRGLWVHEGLRRTP